MTRPTAPPPIADAPPAAISFEDYLKLHDGQHAEWHPNGTVEIVASRHIIRIEMAMFLTVLLSLYLALSRQGEVIGTTFAQKLPGQAAREPDIMIVLNEHLDRIRETYLDGPADIAIKVVSPESVQRDYDDKFKEYAKGGVREYRIVDYERRVFDIHKLDADGRYLRRATNARGAVTSGLLAGFVLDPALLWRDPLPDGEELIALAAGLAGYDVKLTLRHTPES